MIRFFSCFQDRLSHSFRYSFHILTEWQQSFWKIQIQVIGLLNFSTFQGSEQYLIAKLHLPHDFASIKKYYFSIIIQQSASHSFLHLNIFLLTLLIFSNKMMIKAHNSLLLPFYLNLGSLLRETEVSMLLINKVNILMTIYRLYHRISSYSISKVVYNKVFLFVQKHIFPKALQTH